MTQAENYSCPKCAFTHASVTQHEKCALVTCKRCWHVTNIPMVQSPSTVVETVAVEVLEPEFDKGKSDFSLDHMNMITAPRDWWTADGMYYRPHSAGFTCAYITANREHVRFPANPHNIGILVERGIAKRHLSGPAGDRFAISLMERMLELTERRRHFNEAEQLKLDKGVENLSLMGFEYTKTAGSWINVHSCEGRSFYYQQRAAILLCIRVKRALLAYEQRTGKTPTMMAVAKELFDMGEIDAVCVIAPVRLLNTAWADEINRYDPTNRSLVMKSEATRLEAIEFDVNWYLTSFESAAVNWSVIRKLHDTHRVMVIMDETVKIKNPGAKRTLGCQMISQEVDYLYELSGAPVSRLHEDIWAQAFCIDPGVLGDSCEAFAQSFFMEGGGGSQIFRRSRKTLFHELSELYMLRCTRGEAEQFTGRDTYTINVNLEASEAQGMVYQSMLMSYMAVLEREDGSELENEAQNVLVQLLRLREICSGFFSFETSPGTFARARLADNPKVTWLKQFIEDHPGQQAIIFCEFNEGEAIVADTLDEMGVSWGGMLAVDRDRYRRGPKEEAFADHVSDFQAGKRTFFLGKHSSIGHGLTLSAADAAIFWNMGFNSDNYDQARMRPVAGGKCALIYHLMIQGSIETEHIYPTLRSRGNMKATLLRDAQRQGYYSFFETMSKASLAVAAKTTYERDPLESEARKITGYDGLLMLSAIQEWLRGDNPVLNRLDMIRSAGSVANAYRRITSIFDPSKPRNHASIQAVIIYKLAHDALETRPDWEVFISSVAEKLKLKSAGAVDRDNMFDLMLAYLRMKSVDDMKEAM